MKSSSQSISRLRIRSARNGTAPFRIATSSGGASLVVAADLGAELGDPALQVLLGDEHLPDRVVGCHGGGVYGPAWDALRTADSAAPGLAANSSETATPAIQAIRSPASTTGRA